MARAILAEPGAKRGEVVIAAMVAFAMAAWDSGGPTEALDLIAQAARKGGEAVRDLPLKSPDFPAARLMDVGRPDEATAIVNSVESVEVSAASPWPRGNRRGSARPDSPVDGPPR